MYITISLYQPFYPVLSLNLWVNADTELWKNDILQQLALPDVVET